MLGKEQVSFRHRPTRLTLEVVRALADGIVAGGIDDDAPLPSEAEMSQQFGVSRTVIREALNVLENVGLVRKQQGKLSSKTPRAAWDLLDPIVLEAHLRHDKDLRFLDDLVFVRIALESAMAGQAAVRATEADLEMIVARFEALERELESPERYKALDAEFHEAVLASASNPIGKAIVSAIHGYARASRLYSSPDTPLELIALSHEGHADVLRCLQARDPVTAEAAMRNHIASAWAWRHPKRTRGAG